MDVAQRSRRAKVSIIVAFAVFLAVGALGIVVRLPDVLPALGGVVNNAQPIRWSWSGFRQGPQHEGSPQQLIEARVNSQFGWQTFLVRLDNQVTWSAFLETRPPKKKADGSDIGTHVIYGTHEWLFEKHYIRDAVIPAEETEAQILAHLVLMKRVQDKLAKRGIAFLLVVAPSKAEIYPEKVPEYLWRGKSKDAVETKFERARPLFRESGLNWIDGPELFARWKAEGKRNLFARSGTHWSYRSAVDVLALMRERLNATMRRPMPALIVAGESVSAPQGNDRDLLDLANLLVPQPYEHSVPRPLVQEQHAVPEAELPRILWVHDSFGWPLIDPIYWGKVAAPSESLYYFETQMRIPGGAVQLRDLMEKGNWKQLNLPAYVGNKDAVVVVWTEIAQNFWGWGFFEALDSTLE